MRPSVRAAAFSAGLLAGDHAYQTWLQFHDTAYLAVLTGFAAALGATSAHRLWWNNSAESRMITAAVALGALAGNMLVATMGLPGQGHAHPPTFPETTSVVLSCAILLLLTLSSPRTALSPARGRQEEPQGP